MKKSGPIGRRRRSAYHHGNLRAAMIEAAVRMAGEVGPEAVTLREVARRAGVSSGAPFRHFPSKVALMTAVAEEAMHRLKAEIEHTDAETPSSDPLRRFESIGRAYLHWVIRNPIHFRIISMREQIDFQGSEMLRRDNAEIQAAMAAHLAAARRQGRLAGANLRILRLAARALAYGLARMLVDGHLPQLGVSPRRAERDMMAVLDTFVHGLEGLPRDQSSIGRSK